MQDHIVDKLGPPDIRFKGLQIWIHERQFPTERDYWDGNWLNITAHCSSNGASVWTRGPVLHLSEIMRWANETKVLYDTQEGQARLACMEPELSVSIEKEAQENLTVTVSISPDHLNQKHEFKFAFDRDDLPALIDQGERVLVKHPIRGA